MRGFWPVFKRELFSYFVTPLAWVLLFAFVIWQGLHFTLLVRSFTQAPEVAIDQGPVQAFFGGDVFYYLPLVVLCPAMTMRLFAEEHRSGSLESLLTTPVSIPAVVLAKYLAVLVGYAVLWAPTGLYMVILGRAAEVDLRVVLVSYLGVLAIGAPYLAVGLLASATTRSQLVAFALATTVILGMFLLGLGEFVLDDGPLRELCVHLSVWSQMSDWSRGLVDSRRVVLDLSSVAFCLFLTVRTVETVR